MRNIDLIKTMNTEQMAAYLSTFGTCHKCAFGENGDGSCFEIQQLSDIPSCDEGLQKYLETEAEEEFEDNDFEKRSELEEIEIQGLIAAYQLLDDTDREIHVFNKENPSYEYGRLLLAKYSLKEYLTKDLNVKEQQLLLGKIQNHGRQYVGKPELIKEADACTKQLRDLMERYYQYMIQNNIDPINETNYVTQYYWSIVNEYQLSRFIFGEHKLKECKDFIASQEKELTRLEQRNK